MDRAKNSNHKSFRRKYMKMANQTFNPTTAKYLARVDGEQDPQPHPRVTPVCPYDDNNQSCPYDGNWKKSLLPNLGYHYKMRNGILEVYATKVGYFKTQSLIGGKRGVVKN